MKSFVTASMNESIRCGQKARGVSRKSLSAAMMLCPLHSHLVSDALHEGLCDDIDQCKHKLEDEGVSDTEQGWATYFLPRRRERASRAYKCVVERQVGE